MREKLNHHEQRFFWALIIEGSLDIAYRNKFVPSMIVTEEGKSVLRYVSKYQSEHGKVPSQTRLLVEFPELDLPPHRDNVSECIADLKHSRTSELSREAATSMARLFQDTEITPSKLSNALVAINRQLNTDLEDIQSPSTDVDLGSDEYLENYLQELERRAKLKGMIGYSWAWPTINTATRGLRDEQLVVILARTGVGKSWFLFKQGLHLWQKEKLTVLIVSNELSNMGVTDRIISMGSNVPYNRILSGELSMEEQSRIYSFKNALKNGDNKLIITGNDSMSSGGLSSIRAKLKSYNADVVLIDGAYLMDDDEGGHSRMERAANIARGLKRFCKREKVPLLVTWQFNRSASKKSGGDTDSVGLTDNLSTDADMMFAITRSEDDELAKRTRMKSIKVRDCQPWELVADWDFTTMSFEEYQPDDTISGDDDFMALDNNPRIPQPTNQDEVLF